MDSIHSGHWPTAGTYRIRAASMWVDDVKALVFWV